MKREGRTHGLRSEKLPTLRDRYALGARGLTVSPFCLGITNDPRTVCEAFDAGINFFFVTADMHWPLYESLRRGLEMLFSRGGGVRDDVVVGAVSYVTQPEFCFAPFREVIDAVRGLERLEVTIAGGAYSTDLAIRLTQYRQHAAGVVPGARAVGTSFHDRAAAFLALEHAMIDIGFVRYNSDHTGAQRDLFPHITNGAPLLYNFKNTSGHVAEKLAPRLGVEEGSWVPRATDHYRYVLTRAEIDGVLCALTTPGQVKELAAAMDEGPLAAEECEYVEELTRRMRRGVANG